MKNINIFLDDERDPTFVSDKFPNRKWVVIRSYSEFCFFVTSNLENIELISFDHDICSHDLDGVEKTGKDAVVFLTELCMGKNNLPNIWVHSQNPVGKSNIISYVASYLKNVENKNINPKSTHCGYIEGQWI